MRATDREETGGYGELREAIAVPEYLFRVKTGEPSSDTPVVFTSPPGGSLLLLSMPLPGEVEIVTA